MSAPEMFEGFAERRGRLEDDLAQEHGAGVREHFRTAEDATAGWTEQDYLDAQRRGEEVEGRVLTALRSGAAPGSEAAQTAVAEHFREVSRFWTPDRASYTGLGRRLVEDPDQRARYDALEPGLAEYLRDAIAVYARDHLG